MKNKRSVKAGQTTFERLKSIYILSFYALVLTYLGLSFIPSPDQKVISRYGLTMVSYRLLILPIIILVIAIWFVSLYGSLRVKNYALLIKKSQDGRALDKVGSGLLILSLSLPFGADLSALFNLMMRHQSYLQPRLTIINNYVGVGLMGLAFLFIARGVDRLHDLIKKESGLLAQKAWVLLFIIGSTLYSYLLVIQPIHTPLAPPGVVRSIL